MGSVDLVIFDMDDVLCRYDFGRRLDRLGKLTGLDPDVIDAEIFRSGFDDLADRGHYTAEEYLQLFGNCLDVPLSRSDWLWARRQAMIPDGRMLALVERLQAQVPVAMLTNNGPVLREGLGEVFPEAAALFGERALFSCQLRASKAEAAIFPAALAVLGGRPETTLFVDDSPSYIASARAAGLRCHRFTGHDALAAALPAHGLAP